MLLPYRFVVPLPVRRSELLTFTSDEWAILDSGSEIFDLPAALTAEVVRVRQRHPQLSVNDCFCFVTAQHYQGSILLTGDRALRRAAESAHCAVHGVLWIIDQLMLHKCCEPAGLVQALERWKSDPAVFLPSKEIDRRLQAASDLLEDTPHPEIT